MKRIVHDFIWGSVQFSLSLRTMLLNSQIRKYFFKEINDLICDQVSEVRYMYSQDYSQERTQVQKKKKIPRVTNMAGNGLCSLELARSQSVWQLTCD